MAHIVPAGPLTAASVDPELLEVVEEFPVSSCGKPLLTTFEVSARSALWRTSVSPSAPVSGPGRFGRVAGFPLIPHREHEHRIQRGSVAVQRHVAARIAADDQFPFAAGDRPADQGVVPERVDGADDLPGAGGGVLAVMLPRMVGDPVELVGDAGGDSQDMAGRGALAPSHVAL